MKKRVVALLVLVIILAITFPMSNIFAANVSVETETAVLFDADQNSILFEKDAHKKMHPASITKVMTILLACENLNLDDVITVDNNLLLTLPKDAVIADYRGGEQITVKDAILTAYLRSANDAALLLAHRVSGSVEKFAALMNEKAKSLGAENTNFTNPTGLTSDNHYTTAYDMALITKAAVENKKLMEVCSQLKYTLLKGEFRPDDLEITVGHRMLDKETNQFYQGVVFGKTGYTDAAKSTLVTAAQKDGRTLIAVTLSHDDRFKQYKDVKTLLDYGYGSFYRFVLSKDDLKSMVSLRRTKIANIENDFSVILPVEAKRELLTQSVDVIENEIFVTLKGADEDITQKVGYVTENKSGALYIIIKTIKIILTVIGILLLLFILFFIYLIYYVNKRNKKRIAERKKKAQIEANYKYYNM